MTHLSDSFGFRLFSCVLKVRLPRRTDPLPVEADGGYACFFVTVTSANGVVSPAADQLPFGCPKETRERRESRVRGAAVEASEQRANSCRDLLFPGCLLMDKSFKNTLNSN